MHPKGFNDAGGFEFGNTKAVSNGTDEVVLRKSHKHILQKKGGFISRPPGYLLEAKGVSLAIHFVQVLTSLLPPGSRFLRGKAHENEFRVA